MGVRPTLTSACGSDRTRLTSRGVAELTAPTDGDGAWHEPPQPQSNPRSVDEAETPRRAFPTDDWSTRSLAAAIDSSASQRIAGASFPSNDARSGS